MCVCVCVCAQVCFSGCREEFVNAGVWVID